MSARLNFLFLFLPTSLYTPIYADIRRYTPIYADIHLYAYTRGPHAYAYTRRFLNFMDVTSFSYILTFKQLYDLYLQLASNRIIAIIIIITLVTSTPPLLKVYAFKTLFFFFIFFFIARVNLSWISFFFLTIDRRYLNVKRIIIIRSLAIEIVLWAQITGCGNERNYKEIGNMEMQ
jgi:hypothetical protein